VARKRKKITRKNTYEKVRMNSAHVHSILRIFSPVLAGEHAGKARKSSLDLTFRLPKYQVSAAERQHMQLGNVLRVTCISDLPLVLKRSKLHECQVRTQRVKICEHSVKNQWEHREKHWKLDFLRKK